MLGQKYVCIHVHIHMYAYKDKASAYLNAFMFFFLYDTPSLPCVCIRAYTRMHPFAYSANRIEPVALTDTLLEQRSHLAPIVA